MPFQCITREQKSTDFNDTPPVSTTDSFGHVWDDCTLHIKGSSCSRTNDTQRGWFGHARAPKNDKRSNLAATEPSLRPYQCMVVQNIHLAHHGCRRIDEHTRTHLMSEAGRSRGRGRRRAAIRGDTTDDDRSAPSQIGQEACRKVNRCRRGGARVLSTSTA